jgi:hypothetical protein
VVRWFAGLGVMLVLTAWAGAQGLQGGSVEVSGQGAFSWSDRGGPGLNGSTTAFSLSPSLAFYPGRHLFLGPVLSYHRTSTYVEGNRSLAESRSSLSAADIGLNLGFLANWSDRPFMPLPYLGGGAGLSLVDAEFDDVSSASNGHYLSAFAGVKLRLAPSILIGVQPTLTWQSLGSHDYFGFGTLFGFSGLL